MRNSVEILQKIKNRVAVWPSNPSFGYLPEKFENIHVDIGTPVFIALLFGDQDMETIKVSLGRLANQDVHRYNEILLSHKKRWNTAICDSMDGSWKYASEISQTEKVKNHMLSLVCGM